MAALLLFSFVAVCAFSVIESNWPILICLTALLLLTKILTRFAEGGLRALDVIVTSLYCIELLANGKEIPYAYLLLAGTILSMFLVYGWTTIQELLLTFPWHFCSGQFDADAKAAGFCGDPVCKYIAV